MYHRCTLNNQIERNEITIKIYNRATLPVFYFDTRKYPRIIQIPHTRNNPTALTLHSDTFRLSDTWSICSYLHVTSTVLSLHHRPVSWLCFECTFAAFLFIGHSIRYQFELCACTMFSLGYRWRGKSKDTKEGRRVRGKIRKAAREGNSQTPLEGGSETFLFWNPGSIFYLNTDENPTGTFSLTPVAYLAPSVSVQNTPRCEL